MAGRKPSAKVVLARGTLSQLGLAMADGVEQVCRVAVGVADPPDATPYGQGLVTSGGWLVYFGSQKVAGGSLRGLQPAKPRGVPIQADAVTGMAGFGFPARFQEVGTSRQPARPFFTPVYHWLATAAPGIMAPAVRRRLARTR